ncbi:MAG: hypothetical protein ABIP49_00510, partial [Lysobacterales bacterium]
SRYAWQMRDGKARLHFAGQPFDGSVRLARLLQAAKRYTGPGLAALSSADWQCLHALLAAGHLVFGDDNTD